MKTGRINVAKTALVVTYFGKFPEYFDYFLKSCEKNEKFDFLFFCDNPGKWTNKINNAKFINMSMPEFNALASAKLGVTVSVKNGYKLCDLKPMYGKIYEDHLKQYDFWGFCDIDMILGNMSNVITEEKLASYDVISAHDRYLAGPFSLFRNTDKINKIYEKSKDWLKVIEDENEYLAFDEASSVMPRLWDGHNIFDYPSEIESMTHILMNKNKCDARVDFAGFIEERLPKEITWKDGILADEDGCQLALFHYLVYKTKMNFCVPKLGGADSFSFDKNGFFIDTLKGRTIDRVLGFRSSYIQKFKRIKRKLLNKIFRK